MLTKKKPKKVYPAVARNLRKARLEAGYKTVSDAARRMGIPVPSAVAHEGAGTSFRNPKLNALVVYALAYNTTIEKLAGVTSGRKSK